MPSQQRQHLTLDAIIEGVIDVTAKNQGVARAVLSPDTRPIEDLNCDSLALVELFLDLEDRFDVALPADNSNAICKAIFTRPQLRLRDLAEAVYVQIHSGARRSPQYDRKSRHEASATSPADLVPFTQLSGVLESNVPAGGPLYEFISRDGSVLIYRRRTDGMRCALLPGGRAIIGSNATDALDDEQPVHEVELDAFLIDLEPVTITAFAWFLNSIGPVDADVLRQWFALDETDRRRVHELLTRDGDRWQPVPGTETWPMVLVSWYGARAYARWANCRDWRDESDNIESFLPSEAQWEYAARGGDARRYPWGDDEPTPELASYEQHERKRAYTIADLPLSPVNTRLGMSPFGLHHMAGNVWQWCADWYAPDFYTTEAARRRNPINQTPTGVRNERGGSWVGSASLIRSTFRRARAPYARGRCLGFRCIGDPADCR